MSSLNVIRQFVAATALLLFLTTAYAGEGQQRLDEFMNGLDSMKARFVQTLVEPDGTILEKSEGEIWILRPGRFRLEYLEPYRQTYVADGDRVWVYDRDLEQVTVRMQAETLGDTPALLLSGSEPLEQNFTMNELGAHEGFTWVELFPKSNEASFNRVRLALEPKTLRAMEMVDGFGQVTRLFFDRIERNVPVDAAQFRFTPPDNVDVIGDLP